VPPGLSDELTEAKSIERAIARLTRDPNSFISTEVHKHFPEYEGVYRGRVTGYDPDAKYWSVKYDCDGDVCDALLPSRTNI
jgi:hypothetical protein